MATDAPVITAVPSTITEEDSSVKSSSNEDSAFEIGTKIGKIVEGGDKEDFRIVHDVLESYLEVDDGTKHKMAYSVKQQDGKIENLTVAQFTQFYRKGNQVEKLLEQLNNPPYEPTFQLQTKIHKVVDDDTEFEETGIMLQKLLTGRLTWYGPVTDPIMGVEFCFEVTYEDGLVEHLSPNQVKLRVRQTQKRSLAKRVRDFNKGHEKEINRIKKAAADEDGKEDDDTYDSEVESEGDVESDEEDYVPGKGKALLEDDEDDDEDSDKKKRSPRRSLSRAAKKMATAKTSSN